MKRPFITAVVSMLLTYTSGYFVHDYPLTSIILMLVSGFLLGSVVASIEK